MRSQTSARILSEVLHGSDNWHGESPLCISMPRNHTSTQQRNPPFLNFLLAETCNLGSPTRDLTHALCNGGAGNSPLDCQQCPLDAFKKSKLKIKI